MSGKLRSWAVSPGFAGDIFHVSTRAGFWTRFFEYTFLSLGFRQSGSVGDTFPRYPMPRPCPSQARTHAPWLRPRERRTGFCLTPTPTHTWWKTNCAICVISNYITWFCIISLIFHNFGFSKLQIFFEKYRYFTVWRSVSFTMIILENFMGFLFSQRNVPKKNETDIYWFPGQH